MMVTCTTCSKQVSRYWGGRYCSISCQHEYQYRAYIESWLRGHEKGMRGKINISRHVRRFILERADYRCEDCGWNERHPVDGSVLLQVDHVDGDHTNNCQSNLRALCPNCHAKTHTFGGRNRGFGRAARRKVAETVGFEPT